ncbi:uncharacterized protein LOC120357906 [Solenopsis invicta]|uniref:uncharacterized protein LOC120357906 n=1 Tax=Solenopsis invicta TaxID=13686 RepID=UPI00193DC4A1|nr:uncharacterized protein LOC120357906 [Solenopsis invicta]
MEEKVHVQVKDNSPSIERILRPISYCAWLLGVGIAHPRKFSKSTTIIIRIIHLAMCSNFTILNTTFFFTSFSSSLRIFTIQMYLYCLNIMTICISAFYYIYHGMRQYNKWPELMDRLKELDQKIREEISMNDRSIKIVEALAVLITFTCPLIPIIQFLYDYFNSSYLSHSSYHKMFIIIVLFYYILAQSLINSFVFDVVVYVLYCRFQTVNKLIVQLDELYDVQQIEFKIKRIREWHFDICDLARMVNDIHSVYLLFYSVNCFINAVASSAFLFHAISNYKHLAEMLPYNFFYIVYAMQFCLICWTCTLACQESNKTGRLIHKFILKYKSVNLDKNEASNQSSLEMLLDDLDSEQYSNCSSSHNPYVEENFLHRNLDRECVTKVVNDFSTQLQQNRLTFTACHFLELNNTSFCFFVGVIFTYLTIFFQNTK